MSGDILVLTVRPLAISAGAIELLSRGLPRLRVAHRHGVSLSVSGADEIYLGGSGRGLFPLHIVVRERDLWRVLDTAENSPEPAPDGHAPLAFQIDTEGVRVFQSRLTPDPVGMRSERAAENMVALGRYLRSITRPLGLGLPVEALLRRGGAFSHQVPALNVGSVVSEAAMRALIGCGAGSTPAGDDMMIGLLAHAWATAGADAPVVRMLCAMCEQLPLLTTTASVSYLRSAGRGEFASHLMALVRNLPYVDRDRTLALATRVVSHGVTSGLDTLAGFVGAYELA